MKIRIWCNTKDSQSYLEKIIEVDDDTRVSELDIRASDFFWDEKDPDWGWERVEEIEER